MTASLLDGKQVAALIKKEIKEVLDAEIAEGKRPPSLAVIRIGDDPASGIYVANKHKACLEVGIKSHIYTLAANIVEQELLLLIAELNQSALIDGILVQLPLPQQINTAKIIEAINPSKDVDGFHPYNLGCLAQRRPLFRPCTPKGIMRLLEFYSLSLTGKHSVVVGASNIVGRPMALELLLAGSTVTICHRFTQQLQQHIRMADLVVIAVGQADLVNTDWFHEQQIIIDVGIHRLGNGKIRGDIDFNQAREKVAWLTPVPGGVGPMTIASLLQNTMQAAKQIVEHAKD